jgi:hypothetical protein
VEFTSRRIFGRRIDLNRFQDLDLSTDVRRSNLEKTVFGPKIGHFFESTDLKSVRLKWLVVLSNVPHTMV